MIGDDDIRKSLREVADFLRERSEEAGYGMYTPSDPHDFTPDEECTTPEERERHRLACEAWNRGEPVIVPPTWTTHPTPEAAAAYANACLTNGGAAAATIGNPDADGVTVVHCHVGGWGMGAYTIRDSEMLAMARRLDGIADEMPGPL